MTYDHDKTVVTAIERKCAIITPGPRELFIDIDSFRAKRLHDRAFAVFQTCVKCTRTVRPSPSNRWWKPWRWGRYHVVVTLPFHVTAVDRVKLQAILGSDPVRETLGYRALRKGYANPTVFYETPPVPDTYTRP